MRQGVFIVSSSRLGDGGDDTVQGCVNVHLPTFVTHISLGRDSRTQKGNWNQEAHDATTPQEAKNVRHVLWEN